MALTLVLVVLGVATVWGRRPGIVASVLGACYALTSSSCRLCILLPSLIRKIGSRSPPFSSLPRLPGTCRSPSNDALRKQRPGGRPSSNRRTTSATAADEIHDLYNHAPCGYHSLDTHGTFVRINNTELAWLGYTREEAIGKMHFADLLTPEGVRIFQEYFPKLKATGVMRDSEFDLVRKDGTFLPVLISATAITDRDGKDPTSRATVYDITARQRAENEIRMLARLQAEVAELGELALRCARLSEVLDEAVTQVVRVLNVDYCQVLELLPSRRRCCYDTVLAGRRAMLGRRLSVSVRRLRLVTPYWPTKRWWSKTCAPSSALLAQRCSTSTPS